MNAKQTISVVALVVAVSGCSTIGRVNNANEACLPGTHCWQRLPRAQQEAARADWLGKRQNVLMKQETTHSRALWDIRPVSGM